MSPPPLLFDVPLAPYTTFGIGGPASLFTHARTSGQLLAGLLWAREQGVAHVVLGGGSNVLVADDGYDGLVIRNAGAQRIELLPGNRVRADSGVALERLIALTRQCGLSGLEHFAGVPATLGGALRQNLHFLSPSRDRLLFVGDLLTEAAVLLDGAVERVERDWFGFGHDSGALRESGAVVLDATLQLTPAPSAAIAATVHANLAWRRDRHPRHAPRRSAGCVFRNPDRIPAARAIDAAGLRGETIGGAAISRRHANFIVNRGGATAADVRALVALASRRVAEHSGLRLEPEIALVGFFRPPRSLPGAARSQYGVLREPGRTRKGTPMPDEKPPLPPFTRETAARKVQAAEDAWNTRDPERVALAYTEDSVWRNRDTFVTGRAEIVAFLTRKWERELDYALRKSLWSFDDNRIAVRFQYESHDSGGQWWRSYGNELWEFDERGLMRRREASIDDLPIDESERRIFGPRPADEQGRDFPLR